MGALKGFPNPPAMVRHPRRWRGRARKRAGRVGWAVRPEGRRAPHAIRPRLAGARLLVAWIAWLALVLPCQAVGEEAGKWTVDARRDAAAKDGTRARLAPSAERANRSLPTGADAALPASDAEVPLQPSTGPAGAAEPGSATAGDARPALPLAGTAAPGTAKDRFAKRQARRRQRTTVDPRLADLAATRGEVAAVAHLHGAAPIKPAGPTAAAAEHRIRVHDPEKPPEPARPRLRAGSAPTTTLDEGIVREISQRKVLFRMCYESARRRGVAATRADVKWTLAADGTVRDVEVVVAQDAQLSNCIRVVASRPFAGRVGQDIPVAIPLLFVSAQ